MSMLQIIGWIIALSLIGIAVKIEEKRDYEEGKRNGMYA